MTRYRTEPYYSLLTRSGWQELWWAIRHRDGKRYLPLDAGQDTWSHIKYKLGRK